MHLSKMTSDKKQKIGVQEYANTDTQVTFMQSIGSLPLKSEIFLPSHEVWWARAYLYFLLS